jgi:hypothetical protein
MTRKAVANHIDSMTIFAVTIGLDVPGTRAAARFHAPAVPTYLHGSESLRCQ